MLQPLNFNITQCLKQLYRKHLAQEAMYVIDTGEEKMKFKVLQAIHFITQAWK
jgi:DDE superfamily endonuclease.